MAEAASKGQYSTEIESFLDTLFEGQEGYVYTPTKNPKSGYWQQYFFQWPEQRNQVVTHLLDQTTSKDCYVAPSLFKAPSDKKAAWKGTNYIWTEFDGNAPKDTPNGIPAPTIRIQSSEAGHEHWYWRLEDFETDHRVVEGLAKRLAYTLDADKSGWDCSQVLRPPGTVHRTSRKRVRLLKSGSAVHNVGDFHNLVDVTEGHIVFNTNIAELPDIREVIAKYKWPEDAIDLFNKVVEHPHRSSALTRLAFHCIEMGMTNEETYTVLYNADERWKKFVHRTDRAQKLTGLIDHCRNQKARQTQIGLSEQEHFISLGDFKKQEIKFKWLYEGLLEEEGFGVVTGPPGVGKSSFSMRMGFSICLGQDFLGWKNHVGPTKVGFVSLEMTRTQIMRFVETMAPSFSEVEMPVIDHSFFIFDRGYSMALWDQKNQQKLLDDIDTLGIKVLMIDSLKAAGGLDEKSDAFYDWINSEIRIKRKVTVWLIHHNRKPSQDRSSSRPQGTEDMYGSTFISAHLSVAIALHKRSKKLEVICLKQRSDDEFNNFFVERDQHLSFTRTSKPKDEEKEATDDFGDNPFA